MDIPTILLYAIFLALFLLMSVPTVIACYRYWFRGGRLLSERLGARFRQPASTDTHHRRRISEGKQELPRIRLKSIIGPPIHPIYPHGSKERR